MDLRIVRDVTARADLVSLAAHQFGDMVKAVVVDRRRVGHRMKRSP